MNYEREMFKVLLGEFKIPLYFIVTKIQNINEIKNDKPIVIRNYNKVTKDLIGVEDDYKKEKIEKLIFFVNVIGENLMGVDKLFFKVYDDFRSYIRDEMITKKNISEATSKSLIGHLEKPQDIVKHPTKLCEQINFMYRLIARSVNPNEKGATFLSAAFLKIISNVFGIKIQSIEECKRMIQSLNFKLDDKKKEEKKDIKIG